MCESVYLMLETIQWYCSQGWKEKGPISNRNKNIVEVYRNSDCVGIKEYIQDCLENIGVCTLEYLEKWIIGFHLIRRNALKYKGTDIWNYMKD